MKSLEKHGLTVIPVDEELQPGFHEVVREIEGEEKNVGKIAGVVKQGFTLNGKLIRPAQVFTFAVLGELTDFRSLYTRQRLRIRRGHRLRMYDTLGIVHSSASSILSLCTRNNFEGL